jgi:Fur family ferric uptake transcriptional regulator
VLAYGEGRVTTARRAIVQAVDEMAGAFTVDELASVVRSRNDAAGATATVYRAVAAMEEAGYLARVGTREGASLYARCARHAHHHHIVCDRCGRVAPAECPVGPEMSAAAQRSGFTLTRHEVTLYGLCPECNAREDA